MSLVSKLKIILDNFPYCQFSPLLVDHNPIEFQLISKSFLYFNSIYCLIITVSIKGKKNANLKEFMNSDMSCELIFYLFPKSFLARINFGKKNIYVYNLLGFLIMWLQLSTGIRLDNN